jgi:hypothetical protein
MENTTGREQDQLPVSRLLSWIPPAFYRESSEENWVRLSEWKASPRNHPNWRANGERN